MKKTGRAIMAGLVLSLVFIFSASVAFAGSSVSITAKDSAKTGDEFAVKVVFQGEYLGRVKATLTYDPAVISYSGGGQSSGDSGTVKLEGAGEGDDIEFSLQFKAVGPGTSKIQITDSEIYDLDEQLEGKVGKQTSAEIEVTGEPAAEEEAASDGSGDADKESPEQKVEEPEAYPDAEAAEESGDEGGISPKFIAVIAAVLAVILICVIVIARTRRRL